MQEPYKLIPGDGVYAVKVNIDHEQFGGMANIGNQPTFEDRSHAFEVNIFGFDKDIYGKHIKVEFVSRIRSEMKFDGVDNLIAQLNKDKGTALNSINGDEDRKMV